MEKPKPQPQSGRIPWPAVWVSVMALISTLPVFSAPAWMPMPTADSLLGRILFFGALGSAMVGYIVSQRRHETATDANREARHVETMAELQATGIRITDLTLELKAHLKRAEVGSLGQVAAQAAVTMTTAASAGKPSAIPGLLASQNVEIARVLNVGNATYTPPKVIADGTSVLPLTASGTTVAQSLASLLATVQINPPTSAIMAFATSEKINSLLTTASLVQPMIANLTKDFPIIRFDDVFNVRSTGTQAVFSPKKDENDT